jgi:hypothetical protein
MLLQPPCRFLLLVDRFLPLVDGFLPLLDMQA